MLRSIPSWMRVRRDPAHEVSEVDVRPVSLSAELAGFVRAVSTATDVDDGGYREAVERLRADGPSRVREIEAVAGELAGTAHALRQCLLMAVATIELPESADLLRRAALQPQSASPARTRQSGDHPCLESRAATAEEELRVQAVEGLEALAKSGVSPAIDGLVECAGAGSLTVRAVSLAALAEIEGVGERRADATARLAPDDRYLAGLRRVDVRDVTQVADPRVHLRDSEREGRPAPDIDGREPWPVDVGRSTPRAGGGGHRG